MEVHIRIFDGSLFLVFSKRRNGRACECRAMMRACGSGVAERSEAAELEHA